MDWKNIAERAAWTFVQAAAAYLVAAGTDLLRGDVWAGAALAGVAAILSLIKTIAQERLKR